MEFYLAAQIYQKSKYIIVFKKIRVYIFISEVYLVRQFPRSISDRLSLSEVQRSQNLPREDRDTISTWLASGEHVSRCNPKLHSVRLFERRFAKWNHRVISTFLYVSSENHHVGMPFKSLRKPFISLRKPSLQSWRAAGGHNAVFGRVHCMSDLL